MMCHHPAMPRHLTPVQLAIELFGGVRKLARAIGRDSAAVSRWQKYGTIPTSAQIRVLQVAQEKGIELTAHDVIYGRDIGD